jgi:hypothetical protein
MDAPDEIDYGHHIGEITLFDSRAAHAAAAGLDLGPRRRRPPLPSPEALEAMHRAWVRDGYVVRRGPNGSTVYKFARAHEPGREAYSRQH